MSKVPATRPAPGEVSASLRAFAAGLIDYAGLFPPAGLSMQDAVARFAAYRGGVHEWLLASFICPARKLRELHAFPAIFETERPLPLSVIATGEVEGVAMAERLQMDLEAISTFESKRPGLVVLRALEMRIPDHALEPDGSGASRYLDTVIGEIRTSTVPIGRLYLEAGFSGSWKSDWDQVIAAMKRPPAGSPPLGLKLRCGGLTPDVFPTPEQIAFVLARCRQAHIPFKATAGLHHSVRHYDRHLEVMQHGFLNVFGAGVLAHALDLTEPALRQVIRSEQIKAFTFDSEGFAFQDLRISTSQIQRAREDFAHSFGSCSFEDPIDDLKAAGFL